MNANGGQAHSIVLTNKGKVFTFGCNTFGQLGIGTTVKSTTPVKVFGVQEKIINIATSYFHNVRNRLNELIRVQIFQHSRLKINYSF